MTHTPTPWIFNQNKGCIEVNGEKLLVNGVSLPCGNHPESNHATANAQFIVRACNAHDELVAALKLALCQLKVWNSTISQSWEFYRKSPEIQKIEQALANAEKG